MNNLLKSKPLPIGQSDFTNIITQGYYWIDKSRLIADVIDNSANVMLLPRPRRFGKTLNMDMLRCFFSNDADRSGLFAGSWIADQPEYWAQQGQYPVISLTLKGIKYDNWDTAQRHLHGLVREVAVKVDLTGKLHNPLLAEHYAAIVTGKAEADVWAMSLKVLIAAVAEYHQKPVVVLIDEYDTPIHEAYSHGYYREMVNFLRVWLGEGLKDQPHLYRGVFTGIMRVAKESMFSGLNKFAVYPVHKQSPFNAAFGFTQPEVNQLLQDYALADHNDTVQRWYNGYQFGNATIYNPWSILYYIHNQPNPADTYWINTSSNNLVYDLIQQGSHKLKYELEQLMNGQVLTQAVNDAVVFSEKLSENDVWSFLLATGYLTAKNPKRQFGAMTYELFIPNLEVRECYGDIIKNWFEKANPAQRYQDLILAFVGHDFEKFERLLQEFVLALFSYHDFSRDKPGEAVIQAFVLGLLASLTEDFKIRSNRETGMGRADLLLEPMDKTQAGFVIEFKAINDGQDINAVLEQALQQIEVKQYQTELLENGVEQIITLAIVLQGKLVKTKIVNY